MLPTNMANQGIMGLTEKRTVDHIMEELKELKAEVERLKRKAIVNDDLISFWDNSYDERWNSC